MTNEKLINAPWIDVSLFGYSDDECERFQNLKFKAADANRLDSLANRINELMTIENPSHTDLALMQDAIHNIEKLAINN